MATLKTRINISLSKEVDHASMEDKCWEILAREREKTDRSLFLSHKEVWG